MEWMEQDDAETEEKNVSQYYFMVACVDAAKLENMTEPPEDCPLTLEHTLIGELENE